MSQAPMKPQGTIKSSLPPPPLAAAIGREQWWRGKKLQWLILSAARLNLQKCLPPPGRGGGLTWHPCRGGLALHLCRGALRRGAFGQCRKVTLIDSVPCQTPPQSSSLALGAGPEVLGPGGAEWPETAVGSNAHVQRGLAQRGGGAAFPSFPAQQADTWEPLLHLVNARHFGHCRSLRGNGGRRRGRAPLLSSSTPSPPPWPRMALAGFS